MKVWLLTLLFLIPFISFGQKRYTIEGKVGAVAPGARVELIRWYGNMGETIAVDTIHDGRFAFCGEVDHFPARMSISVEGDSLFYGERTLWVGEQAIRIEENGPCVSFWKVRSRLKLQREENKFVENTAEVGREYERFRHDYRESYLAELRDQRKKNPEMKEYPIQRRMDSLGKLNLLENLKTLEQCRILSEVGLERLYPFAREIYLSKAPRISREVIERLFLRLEPSLNDTPRALEIRSYLYPCKVVGIGDEMADGVLFDLDGKEHRLSDYKGKYILLDFWSSGCGPCLAAHPELNKWAGTYREQFYVISINLDLSEHLWREASKGLTGINLSDLKGEGGIMARYGCDGIPKFVVVNPEGRIVEVWFGYWKNCLNDKLAKYLKNNDNQDK